MRTVIQRWPLEENCFITLSLTAGRYCVTVYDADVDEFLPYARVYSDETIARAYVSELLGRVPC